MARTVTLTTLISDVRTKGDFAGATVRHTDAQITRLLNQSIQRFRERISDEGSEHYLVSSSGTLGVGPTSPYPFYQLDLSAASPAIVRTYGIDVTFPGGDVKTLDRVPFEMRAKYGTTTQGGTPQAWAPFKRDQVAILPASSTAYAYTVWYLPVLADLSSGSDTFDGVAGWEDFLVWDVVVQLIARDQFPQAYGIAVAQRDGVWADIVRGATKVTQAGGAHLGRDSFGGKLPLFLGDRRPTKTAAGGPVVPATGSVTDAMLADMTGPSVKGVLSGTTRPYSIGVATLTTYLSQFSTTQRGLVPAPGGLGQLFLRDDGTWTLPAGGGGAGNSVGPSGAIQFQAGTGFAGASGFRIHGNSPSLLVRLDGSFRLTGGQLEVGSGTVRVSASGVDVGGGSVVNVGTLVASAIAAPAVTTTTAGLAPASGGGSTNFLRADGTWAAPPGTGGSPAGSQGNIQYNAAGSFEGATAVAIATTNGGGLAFGDLTELNSAGVVGNVRVATQFSIQGRTPSGSRQFLYLYSPVNNTTEIGSNSGTVTTYRYLAPTGGSHRFRMGQSGVDEIIFRQTGIDARFSHLSVKSLSVSSGIPNTELSPMASGTVKGQMDADGIPQDIPLASLTTALYPFDSNNRGVVPGSGGGTTNFLRADGSWAAPAGSSAVGPTGAIQYQSGSAFDGASGFRIIGNSPSLIAWLDGSMRMGGPFQVGSGPPFRRTPTGSQNGAGHAVRIFPTGIDIGFGGIENVATLSAEKVILQSLELSIGGSGIGNPALANMASGTVKANLSGLNPPGDVQVPTLFIYAPTFTSTRAGIVPDSGGGTSNFLRADGTWAAPPAGGGGSMAGGSGAIQYAGNGAVSASDRWTFQASGTQLVSGTPTGTVFGAANLGIHGVFTVQGKSTANEDQTLYLWSPSGLAGGASGSVITYGRGSGTIQLHRFQTAPSGSIEFELGPSGANSLRFMQTGVDFSGRHLRAKSLAITDGIANSELASMASGTIKGQLGPAGTPNDVSFATFMAFAPTFTSTKMGTVPASGGGTTNFLRADGTWAAPPGGSATPGGADTNLQYNNVGAFGGASGLNVAAPGALGFGVPSLLPGAGDIRVASGFNITGNLPSGVAGVAARQNLLDWTGGGGSGTLKLGGASGVLGTLREEVATGGSFQWLIGGQTGASLSQTGIDLSNFHINAKSINVPNINGLPHELNNLKRGYNFVTNASTGVPSGMQLYLPRGAASGANRWIIPSGTVPAARTIFLIPSGGKAGEVMRLERNDTSGFAVTIATPTGQTLHVMPSGTKSFADFMFTKPSGVNLELAGHADMF